MAKSSLNPEISLVVPMYNEELSVDRFLAAVWPHLEAVTDRFEIICVNDGSSDATAGILRQAHERDPRIKLVDLSRNFGKELALTAGIDHASGDAVIPIDADLQDPPELIPDMVAKWREGYEMVLAQRTDRLSDSLVKRTAANMFYRIMQHVGGVSLPANVGDYRLMDRAVVDALQRFPERTRFMKGLFASLGFRQAVVSYKRPPRMAGSSKFKFWKLWSLALESITSFSTLPLRIWSYFGFAVSIAALIYMAFIIVRTLYFGVDMPGYASLMVVVLIFSGLNMIGLGILGEYLGRVFVEVKQRPLYLVREAVGFDDAPALDEARDLREQLQRLRSHYSVGP